MTALTVDGSLWLLISRGWGHRIAYQALHGPRAQAIGLHLCQPLAWFETFGVNFRGKFNRCTRDLLWFTKHKEKFVFNDCPEIHRKSDGERLADVWGIDPPIPRVAGTHAERVQGVPTQLPLRLLRPILAGASDPGDLVVDPFAGSGTTGVVCIETGRRYIGVELSETFASLARNRLCNTTPGLPGVA
jgi:DNA modification methylase